MMSVITETQVKPGCEADWDRAYQARAADARNQPGWVALQLLIPEDDPEARIVVGTWQSREDWQRWHQTDTFKRTRDALDAATAQEGDERWHRVVEEGASAAV